jgi:hypothetical protein
VSDAHATIINLGEEPTMKTMRLAVCALAAAGLAGPSLAQTPAEDVTAAMEGELAANMLEGCRDELAEHCSAVTPGQGRVLACLYAHGDKLSGQCDYALYDSAARLERAISAVTYVGSACRAELQTHCTGVELGEGRVAQCLKDHASELGPQCDQALVDVGVK